MLWYSIIALPLVFLNVAKFSIMKSHYSVPSRKAYVTTYNHLLWSLQSGAAEMEPANCSWSEVR